MPSNTSSNLPRLLRSASNASNSMPPDSRLTRSSIPCQTNPPLTAQQLVDPPVTRSRFGFASSASSASNHIDLSSHITDETSPINHHPLTILQSGTSRSSRIPSGLVSQTIRPTSALGRPASSLVRPSALGRPATALGTRSQKTHQSNGGPPQSVVTNATNRKRRTSSVSSQRRARSSHPNQNSTSTPTSPDDAILRSDLEKQLTDALEKLTSAQEECNRFMILSHEETLRANQSEENLDQQRLASLREISRLQEQHAENVKEIQEGFDKQLRHSQEQIEHLQSVNSNRSVELERATNQVSCLHSEIEQMDVDSGLNAAQVIELTRAKTELETKLQASQVELRETHQEHQNRIEQVTKHYHNIQSKLHQDLEQITAEYQACLQQQSITPSETVEELTTKIQQLEKNLSISDGECQKIRSELDRLIESNARHEEEKRGWDLVRNQLVEDIRELELQREVVKRRKITTLKVESNSPSNEIPLIDFTMMMSDNEAGETEGRLTRCSGRENQKHCSNDSPLFKSVGQVDNSLTSGLSSLPMIDINPENMKLNEPSIIAKKESSYATSESEICSSTFNQVFPNFICPQKHADLVAELNNLQAEVTSLQSQLHTAHGTIIHLKVHQLAAQTSSDNEQNLMRNNPEAQLLSSRELIDGLKSKTVSREVHADVQKNLEHLQSQLLNLTAKLESSQETIRTLNVDLNTMQIDRSQELDRLSEVHTREIRSSMEQINQLKTELDEVTNLYAQTSSRLQNLAAFSPERVSVLTSRLREERDEARNAMEFMQIEQKAIEQAALQSISELKIKHQNVLNEAVSERNDLVVTSLTLYQALQSWTQAASLRKKTEHNPVNQAQDIKLIGMDDSLVDFNNVVFNCNLGNTDANLHRSIVAPHIQSNFESHFGIGINAQAHAITLEQVSTLTRQVQDLKEQLLQAYLAHQEQEKQTLAELESTQHDASLLEEQYAQIEKQQTNKISSLELKFSGIQHQFQSLEVSYNSLREEKAELQAALENERKKLERSELDMEALNCHTDRLRSQIHSMEATIKIQEKHVIDLERQLAVANLAPDLLTQIEELTHDLQEQKNLVNTLEQKLETAHLLQRDHVAAVEKLKEKLNLQEIDQRNELERKNAEVSLLKEDFEKHLSNFSDSLDQKAAVNVGLQGTVDSLSAEIQEANDKYVQTQAKTKEIHQLLESQLDDSLQKFQVMEIEKENLILALVISSDEHKAFKVMISSELVKTRDELKKAIESRDSMCQRLIEFHAASEKQRENFKQSQLDEGTQQSKIDSLSSQIESMQATIQIGNRDVEDLKQLLSVAHQSLTENENSDLPSQVEQLTRRLEEQEVLIESLDLQLQAANSIQEDRQVFTERLQEALRSAAIERENESESKEAEMVLLKKGLEEKSSKISNLLDEKSTIIIRLQEEVGHLTARIQEAHQKHQQSQEGLECELAELNQEQKAMHEKCQLLELREAELRIERQNELESKEAEMALLNERVEEEESKISNLLDEKSRITTRLQEEVGDLTAQIQQAHQTHQQIQAELECALAELHQQRKIVDEKCHLLEHCQAESRETVNALETEKKNLIIQLNENSAEYQTYKDKIIEELSQSKQESLRATETNDMLTQQLDSINIRVRVLTEELALVKSQQSMSDNSLEQNETLSSEFQALKKQLSTVTTDLELMRSQYVDASSQKQELSIEVKEKDLMINSLKADLATVSKLHNRLSSNTDTTTDKIKELETRIESKSAEVEDALDRLLDEMQKNKRLSVLVETLKVKLKSKTKAVVSLDGPFRESGDDAMRMVASCPSGEEVEGPLAESNNLRKRKHESTVQPSRLRTEVGEEDSNTNKENPRATNAFRSIRRKISNSTKPTVLVTEPEHQNDENAEDKVREVESSRNLAILQPISPNRPSSLITTKTSPESKISHPDLKSSNQKLPPPSIKTNSNLLASIQSLRRKQQLKHHVSSNQVVADAVGELNIESERRN